MKRAALFLLLVATVSCEKEADPIPVVVAVQSWFENDNVRITIDDEVLIDQVVNTNPSLGVCFIDNKIGVRRELKKGRHQLRATVNETLTHTTEIDVTVDLYIGVGYDEADQAITFIYATEPFAYD